MGLAERERKISSSKRWRLRGPETGETIPPWIVMGNACLWMRLMSVNRVINSVTRWLDCGTIFGHLEPRKLAQ